MRIIGGFFKGKKILDPIDVSTRPLKDLVRESIFNILEHSKNEFVKLNKANVLDLFSGTGSFGIECLSRGAEKVIFLDENVQEVVLPSYEGEMGILKDHIPIISFLRPGIIKILKSSVIYF